MRLIVGLGNPGANYQGTRHNIGFQVLDFLAEGHNVSFAESKWQAKIARCTLWGQSVILVKPETYMNESGVAVGQIASFYRIPPQDIIVFHDDLDLALARIKIACSRGAGGHNGILSLIAHLGTRDFVRIRLGIGRPDPTVPVKNFVLSRFLPEEQSVVLTQMDTAEQVLLLVLDKGHVSAMSTVNSNKIN
jgi:PTH1 family peptidyl-tRNA hydrolase